jgi:hypothetical protein
MNLVLIILVAAFFTTTVFLWARSQDEEENYSFCRCRGCGQKLRYLPRKVGRSSLCPRCGDLVVLPAGSRELALAEDLREANQGKVNGGLWRAGRLLSAGQEVRP